MSVFVMNCSDSSEGSARMRWTGFVIGGEGRKILHLLPYTSLDKRDELIELYLNEDGELHVHTIIPTREQESIIGVVTDISDHFRKLCQAAALLDDLKLSQEAVSVNKRIQKSPLGDEIRKLLR